MKKFVTFLCAALCALAFCFSFFGCKDEAEQVGEKLAVRADSNGNYVAVPLIKDISYINIFRKNVTNEDDPGAPVNIGQIIPTSNNKNVTFQFVDGLVNKGSKYIYIARYNCDGVVSVSAEWSDVITAVVTDPDSREFGAKFETDTPDDKAYFKYDNFSGAIVLMGNILPSDISSISAIMDTDNNTTETFRNGVFAKYTTAAVFNVSGKDTTTIFPVSPLSFMTDSTPVYLSSILNTNYFNTDILIKGIVYQKVEEYRKDDEEDNPLEYTTVYWSVPVKIEVKGDVEEKEDYNTFIVPLRTTNEGDYDYSDTKVRSIETKKQTLTYDYSDYQF